MASIPSRVPFSLLIVEDDPTARSITARMVALKFPECTIYSAEDGKKGLQLFREHPVDMVLTDINMPEMDGIEMARQIRVLSPDATYIVLTAYGDQGFFEQFQEIGFCAYLMKPVDFKELFVTIEKCILGGKQGRAE
jgi:YesN/AraC family two-component response regulator